MFRRQRRINNKKHDERRFAAVARVKYILLSGGGGEELSGVGEKPRRKLASNLSAQTEGKYDGKVSRTK